jgi:hypothetical protein
MYKKATNTLGTREDLILIRTFQHHRNEMVREDISPNKEFTA